MLRALTSRSTGARSLVLLQFEREATRVVDTACSTCACSVNNGHIDSHRWFGTREWGRSLMETERYLFEEYVKQHKLSSLANAMEKEMFQEELDDEQRQMPIRSGGFEYSFQNPDGEYPALYRIPCAGHGHFIHKEEGEEEAELVLDTSELCVMTDKKDLELQELKISRQGNILLILALLDGVPCVFTRDLNKKKTILQDHIHGAMNVEYDMNDEIYFTRPDELGRPSKVYAAACIEGHGDTETSTPRLVFEDTDKRYFVGIQRTKDWKYICINSVSKTSSEVHLVDPETNKVVLVRAREPHCEYVVEHAHNHLILLSNHEDIHENRLYVANISHNQNHMQIDPWTPAQYRIDKEDAFLSDVTVHASACTLLEKLPNGLPRIRVLPFSLQSSNRLYFENHYDVPLPEWALDVQFGSNEDFTSNRVELELQSPILPPIYLDWDLKLRQIFSQSSLDYAELKLQQYTALRVPLQSSQGHTIPLTLTYRNDAQNPSKCLFVVYGAYGECLDMGYQSHMFPLLQRGWKIVYVHVRGGGEKGRAWYHAGRTPHKVNSEMDLYECIKQLTEKGILSMIHISL